MHEAVQREEPPAREAAQRNAERAAAHDGVELIAVHDEQPAAVARRVDGLRGDFDVAEFHADCGVQIVIVITGYVDDASAFLALLQEQLQRFRVARGPVEVLAQVLEVDDVADEIELLAARVAQEIEQ